MRGEDLIEVTDFFNTADAELARAHLTAEGIQAVVAADDAGGMYPGLSIGRIRLLVRAKDLPRAQDILGV